MTRRWALAARWLVTAVVLVFIGRALARNWTELRNAHLTFDLHAGWLAAAVAWIAVTYSLQVQSWRTVLAGWRQRIGFTHATEVWCLANLGRYIPGKVWSVAGLVVLAQRRGVSGSAAAASSVAVQALGLGTCLVTIALTLPGRMPPIAAAVGSTVAIALLVALGSARVLGWAGRRVDARLALPALPVSAIVVSALFTLASWMTYGASFWALARGIGLTDPFPFSAAAGIFAWGYLVGLLAIISPGGLGVREAAFFTLLTPLLGTGGALAMSIASRLLLTVTEVGAAGLATVLARRGRHAPVEDAKA